MPVTREMLQAAPEINDKLWPFDFEPQNNQSHGPVWFETASLAPFEIVARRRSGCVFALVGPQQRLLLATSEGHANIIAASLQEGLELIVAHPHRYDIGQQADGDLAEMQRILRDEIEDFEEALDNEVVEFRPWLRERLHLETPADPAGLLHHALIVLTSDFTLRDVYGNSLEPLFGASR